MDSRTSGRLGWKTIIVNIISLMHAILLGMILALLIHPGDVSVKQGFLKEMTEMNITKPKNSGSPKDAFTDLLRNLFTENLFRSMFQQQKHQLDGTIQWVDGMNVLGLILFSIALGVTISSLGEKAKPVAEFFIAFELVTNRLMRMVMWTGLIGIPSMIAEKVLEVADVFGTIKSLFMLIVTLFATLLAMMIITVPLAYFVLTRKNPYRFLYGLMPATIHGFATSSSVASIPITTECLIKQNLDPRIVKFFLPLSIILNTIGSASYQSIAPIFIAQINGINLNGGQLVTLCLTAFLSSMGSATIPSAGLITMILVLSSLGLPLSDISLIFAIDWFLDRFRTVGNLTLIGLTCGIMDELCKKDLEECDINQEDASQSADI